MEPGHCLSYRPVLELPGAAPASTCLSATTPAAARGGQSTHLSSPCWGAGLASGHAFHADGGGRPMHRGVARGLGVWCGVHGGGAVWTAGVVLPLDLCCRITGGRAARRSVSLTGLLVSVVPGYASTAERIFRRAVQTAQQTRLGWTELR